MSTNNIEPGSDSTDDPTPQDVVAALPSDSPADVFQALCDSPDWDRVTIPANTDLEAAFSNWSSDRGTVYAMFRSDDPILEWADIDDVVFTAPANSDYCSECDENAAVSIGMGTPPKTAQRKRDRKNCSHANLVRKCDSAPQCDCGSRRYYRYEKPVHRETPGGETLETGCIIELQCAKCDDSL